MVRKFFFFPFSYVLHARNIKKIKRSKYINIRKDRCEISKEKVITGKALKNQRTKGKNKKERVITVEDGTCLKKKALQQRNELPAPAPGDGGRKEAEKRRQDQDRDTVKKRKQKIKPIDKYLTM